MRSTWPFLAATAAIGLGLGTWIAGFPTSEGSISVAQDATPGSILPVPIDPANTVPIGPTSSLPPITVTPTTEPPRQPVPSTDPTTTAAPETVPPTTAAPTTAAPTTAAPTTASPTTVPATLLDRSQVRLVLANGDGRWNLVGANVARLEPLGYVEIDQTDIDRRFDRTVLYVRPGFEDEAARLAADLLVPGALVEPLPAEPVTINDELGDIVVVLGPDAVR